MHFLADCCHGCRKCLRGKVGIALGRQRALMAENAADRVEVDTRINHRAGGAVAQIVEVQVPNPKGSRCALHAALYRALLGLNRDPLRIDLQPVVYGHQAPLTVFRVIQPERAVLDRASQDFAQAHPAVEGDQHRGARGSVRDLAGYLQHLLAVGVVVPLVAHRRQLHALGRIMRAQLVELERISASGAEVGQAVADGGRRQVIFLGLVILLGDFGQLVDEPIFIRRQEPGELGLLLLSMLELRQPLPAVNFDGFVYRCPVGFATSCKRVESASFFLVEFLGLSACPALRK